MTAPVFVPNGPDLDLLGVRRPDAPGCGAPADVGARPALEGAGRPTGPARG